MDLGTANSVIVNNAGRILLDEPSIVALDHKTDKMIALGEKARQMHGKTHENIRTVRPLRDGVIADFDAAEQMIRGMIKMANKNKRGFFAPTLRVVICIPSGSTEVEIRAVRDSAEHAGGRDVFMIFEPMAAALGIGLDVEAPEGNMIVDIGGGTTEIAVISLGVFSINRSRSRVTTSPKIFRTTWVANLPRWVTELLADQDQRRLVLTELDDPRRFCGAWCNRMTSLHGCSDLLPGDRALHREVGHQGRLGWSALEQTPPELYADIAQHPPQGRCVATRAR